MNKTLDSILFNVYNPGVRMEDVMFENGWIEVIYKCGKCGAEDKDRRLADDHSPIPPAANCWKCGAGKGLDPVDMLQSKKGMFPISIPAIVTQVNPGRLAVVDRHPN